MTYVLDIPTCLINAERRISDMAHVFEIVVMRSMLTGPELVDLKRRARMDMLAREQEAREFYAEAAKSGWAGDADALIAAHWATYLPMVPAKTIVALRELAVQEAAHVAG